MARTPRHPLQLRPLAAAVLGAALLTGCTGDDPAPEAVASSPPASTPASSSPSTEPSPSPSPSETGPAKPERPAAMDRKDGEGAAAAVKHFFALQQYMFASGDSASYEAMVHRACDYCASMLDNAAWLDSSDSTYEGGARSVEILQVYDKDALTAVTPLDIRLTTEEAVIRGSDGESVERLTAETIDIRAELGRRDGEWVVVGMPPMPEEQ